MAPSRAPKVRQRRQQTAEEVAALTNPEQERIIDVPTKGARRKYVYVGTSWDAFLTHRQRVERNRYVKLGAGMGRLWEMARGDGREKSIEEIVAGLSPEELVRGQIKDKNGNFTGAPPTWVPRAFHRACVTELMRRGKALWQENYLEAIEAMTKIATGKVKGVKPADQLKAAAFVIERLEGKVPEKLMVQTDQPWLTVLDGIVAEVSDEQVARGQKALAAAQEVLDSEVVDIVYDEDEDDEPEPVPPRRPAARRRRS